jgi:hypothetical protein
MGKSTPNWYTFSRFPGNLAYINGWLLRLWFCKLFPLCEGPRRRWFFFCEYLFFNLSTCILIFYLWSFLPQNVYFVALPPPLLPLFPPLCRHPFHRRRHFRRKCWHSPSSPAWAENGGSRRHGKVRGAGEWSIAWKGPLQWLDITIFDDILFKQMAFYFAPHIRFVELTKSHEGTKTKIRRYHLKKVVSSFLLRICGLRTVYRIPGFKNHRVKYVILPK